MRRDYACAASFPRGHAAGRLGVPSSARRRNGKLSAVMKRTWPSSPHAPAGYSNGPVVLVSTLCESNRLSSIKLSAIMHNRDGLDQDGWSSPASTTMFSTVCGCLRAAPTEPSFRAICVDREGSSSGHRGGGRSIICTVPERLRERRRPPAARRCSGSAGLPQKLVLVCFCSTSVCRSAIDRVRVGQPREQRFRSSSIVDTPVLRANPGPEFTVAGVLAHGP